MVGDILRVKISVPPLGTNILPRPARLKQLEEGLSAVEGFMRKLTLVSAPAGFGKTTLVRAWLVGREKRTSWYTLDEGDNKPERYWSYLISALQLTEKGLGKGPLEMLRSQTLHANGSSAGEALLTPLLNDLFALQEPLFLVLDDYHLLDNPHIHKEMIFLLENLPPLVHLIVTTRSDPPWPLSRWHARGKMAEIRLNDLKFSEEEAERLLTEVKAVKLNEIQFHNLYRKTEGWVAGLQLAAFFLANNSNVDTFIESFAGSHRHVLHYLGEEVFNRQPAEIQDFLMQTSVLNRFSAPLCNAVTGRKDSDTILHSLERNNLFVISLDEEGAWYRYHQLFADLLFYQLKKSAPQLMGELHARALRWFLEAGEPGEAVRQALASGYNEEVGQILHDHYDTILHNEGPGKLYEYLADLPSHLLNAYPRLVVHKALFCLIHEGKEKGGHYLELAAGLSYADKKEQQAYAGMLAAVKAYDHVYDHAFAQALENAATALKLLPTHNYYWRMNVAIYSGDARLFSGSPKEAYPFYLEAHRNTQKSNNAYLALTTGFKVATSLDYLGRLGEAEIYTRRILNMAREQGFSKMPRAGLLWALLGELLREKGKLEEAERCVERGLFLSEPEKPSLGWNYLYQTALAFSKREDDKGLATLKEIEALDLETRLPAFITIPAALWEARILLRQGKSAGAAEALSRAGLGDETVVQGGRGWDYLVRARLLLGGKERNLAAARSLLEQVQSLATAGGHMKLLIETLLVKSSLAEMEKSPGEAENCLLTALQHGFEGEYMQVFLDEGTELEPVFSRVMEKKGSGDSLPANEGFRSYLGEVRARLFPGREIDRPRPAAVLTESAEQHTDLNLELVEALSARELEVLGLISEGLSNEAIAKQLFVSVGTVKWHTTNIYGKMGVRRRTEAIALARKLKILP